jgi:hypothetical protein
MRRSPGFILTVLISVWAIVLSCGASDNGEGQVGFNRIIHGWTNYSTAFDTTHDSAANGDYSTIATPYTPNEDVRLLDYGAIVIWNGTGGEKFNLTNFSFEVHIWSGLEAFTNAPRRGDISSYLFQRPTGGSTIAADAVTRGGRPAYEIRFCLTNAPTTLSGGHTWLIGLVSRALEKSSGHLFVPTSNHAGESDFQASSLIVGGWLSIADAGGLTIYDGQLATELFVTSSTPPYFLSGSRLVESGFIMSISATRGTTLRIQRSSDLLVWSDWLQILAETNITHVVDTFPPSSRAFYRLRTN